MQQESFLTQWIQARNDCAARPRLASQGQRSPATGASTPREILAHVRNPPAKRTAAPSRSAQWRSAGSDPKPTYVPLETGGNQGNGLAAKAHFDADEHGVAVSLRTVERAVKPLRQQWRAQALATVRFETAPGAQLQIDFGERAVMIAGERERVYLFVATLGYSRRLHVRVFRHERQASWFDGMESAFAAFGGVAAEVLLDNARALVVHHDPVTREVQFNDRLLAFAKHWEFVPRACAPYRARTKGKDERGVGYVKHNALAGREFASFAALEAHLEQWVREIADVRVHGTTGEAPIARFAREAAALKSIAGKPPFTASRLLQRRVQADCCVEVERNAYSVPWRLIGEPVHVELGGGQVRIFHAGRQVAEHVERLGRRERAVLAEHYVGVAKAWPPSAMTATANELLRPLAEYETLAGGSW